MWRGIAVRGGAWDMDGPSAVAGVLVAIVLLGSFAVSVLWILFGRRG
jgi:hypothetical protein